jgi:hypothetical protein
MNETNTEAIVVFISLKEAVEYLIENCPGSESPVYYETIVGNLAIDVLGKEESIGSPSDCFNDAVESLKSLGLEESGAYKLCSSLLDLIISIVVAHFPDYDHPKYCNNMSYEFTHDLNKVKIFINANSVRPQ